MENGNKCDLKVRHSKEFRKCSTQDAIAESCNHVTISPLCVDSKTITKENHRLLITLLTDFGRKWSMEGISFLRKGTCDLYNIS